MAGEAQKEDGKGGNQDQEGGRQQSPEEDAGTKNEVALGGRHGEVALGGRRGSGLPSNGPRVLPRVIRAELRLAAVWSCWITNSQRRV
eukprot:78823-Chlamydomonas_euryale.AAC.7